MNMKVSKNIVAFAVLMWSVLVQANTSVNQGVWQASLQGRDLDGNVSNGYEAYYDKDLDITWLSDASYAKTVNFDSDGYMNWAVASNWVGALVVNGVSGWRLPTMTDFQGDGCVAFNYAGGSNVDCGYNIDASLSELAHLWYVTLGNKSFFAPGTAVLSDVGTGLTNTGPFLNLSGVGYWTNVSYAPFPDERAWEFGAYGGFQDYYPKARDSFAWPVRDGDVAAVPEPGGAFLGFAGVGALLLILSMRRRTS
jgi:hypothetical protein